MKIKVKVNKKIENIKISTPYIKLDSFLKFSGALSTGGAAKEVISCSEVKVNGEECIHRGKKLFPGDIVQYDNIVYKVTDK
jgi:ribosome-associated protein